MAISLHNYKPKQLRRTRAAQARAYNKTGLFKVGGVGDSTQLAAPHATAYKDSPIITATKHMAQVGYVKRGTGLVPCFNNYAASDPRITWFNGQARYSPFSNLTCNWTTANGVMFSTKQSGETGTVVEVWYADTSPAFDVTIDSGARQTVTTGGTQTMKCKTFSVPDGVHEVIAWPTAAGSSPYILGFGLRANAEFGIETYNAGISGAKTDSLASNDWTHVSQTVANWGADLIIMTCTTNDAGTGTPVDTFKQNFQKAIYNCQSQGADILLTTGTAHQTDDHSAYVQALYELADFNDLPLLDFHERWGTWEDANKYGLMNDAAHPSVLGYNEQGKSIFEVLRLIP